MTHRRAARLRGLVQSEIRRMTRECDRVGGINLGQGICDVAPPPLVIEAARAAMLEGANQYSKPEGIPELRRALATKLRRDNGIEADPDAEVVVTAGVTGGYTCAVNGLLDPGDGILLPVPYYGYHLNIALAAGLEPQFLPLDPPHAPLEEDALRAALRPNTRALVLCTPANPSGKMMTRAELAAVARVAAEHDLLVISDEIYEYFVYDGREHVPSASLPELWPRTVTLLGASKTFAITGWRIGYAVAAAPLAASILLAHDLHFICAPRPLQQGVAAGVAGLAPAWYRDLAAAFQRKRDVLCAALRESGFEPLVPQGSYYALADVAAHGYASAHAAAMDLLERAGVATVPGTAFFPGEAGERCLRICFAKEDPVLEEACERIRRFEPRPS